MLSGNTRLSLKKRKVFECEQETKCTAQQCTKEFEDEAVRGAQTNGRTRPQLVDALGIGLPTLTCRIALRKYQEMVSPPAPNWPRYCSPVKGGAARKRNPSQERDILNKVTANSTDQRNMIYFIRHMAAHNGTDMRA